MAAIIVAIAAITVPPASAEPARRGFVTVAGPGQGEPGAGTHGRLRLYVEERGSGDAIVLLHGFGASSYFWRRITPALAKSHRVIAIDLKGFGRSDKPVDGRYSVTEHARVIRAFLAGRGLAYPQTIPNTIAALQRPGFGELMLDLIPAETIAEQTLIGAAVPGTPIYPADIAAYAMPLRSPGGKEALIATARTFDPNRYMSLINRIGTIRARTLVMTCRFDNIVPLATAVRLAHTIPGAEITVFDGCNHVAPEEKPARVSRRILTFLGE